MPKTQFNVRVDDATREKLEWLKRRYDSYSKVFSIAIDRLYQDERRTEMAKMFPEYIEWRGAGWYGPVQTGHHESTAIGWFAVSGDFREDGYSDDGEVSVWDVTKSQGLGTPRWFDSADELERRTDDV